LLTGAEADWIRKVAGRLECEECGCASRGRAEGWAAFLGEDPARIEPPCIGVFCPRCAGDVFEYRPSDGRDYT
jgi:hypothetical protein